MKKIALIGNPNVGKSTIFNALTGMHQHTGNWPGKTVASARGIFNYKEKEFEIIDLPGTYSLIANSEEEMVSRDYLLYNDYDLVIVVCDSLCLERNLNLVFQILEITNNMIVVVNLLDEAKKKNIDINLALLEEKLGVKVVGTAARSKIGINELKESIVDFEYKDKKDVKIDIITEESFTYNTANKCNTIIEKVVKYKENKSNTRNHFIDKMLTNKYTAIPLMLIFMMFIFWLTITGANYPSNLLFKLFSSIENNVYSFLNYINIPNWINDLLVNGILKTLGWVVSVMLPPMAIFFPLFTLLEDLGILPRIAFNLDKGFQKCNSCGKQSLCMMMGFGCNAAGVVGTRIIDSKRERLIAILTNSLIPCNGRFPILIVIISMFLAPNNSLLNVLILTMVIIVSIIITFFISWLLSKTILKGYPSSFTLELPPYRKPQVIKVIIRSIFDKTLHILGRSIIVTIPVGIIIYILANVDINNISILNHINNMLDPLGKILGLDGVIIVAFLLGFPANEIVLPIILMSYLSMGTLTDYTNIIEFKKVLLNNNWTILTAINMLIMVLFHFPCATTCLTIKKETGSIKWMFISMLIPLMVGILICILNNIIFCLIN